MTDAAQQIMEAILQTPEFQFLTRLMKKSTASRFSLRSPLPHAIPVSMRKRATQKQPCAGPARCAIRAVVC